MADLDVDSVRKLKCDKCGTRFKYPERLKKHKEIAHKKKNADLVVKNFILQKT